MLDQETNLKLAPISVIIPCFNSSETIDKCLSSVINQTLLPSEILLIDDCSSDKGLTKKRLKTLQEKYNDKVSIKTFFSSSNKGPGSSRNLGWENANYPYLAFLDSDDVWEPNKIMCQWNYLKDNPEVKIIGSNIKEKQCCKKATDNIFKELKPKHLLLKNPFCNSSVVLVKNIPYRFEEKSYFSEDFMLWAKVICDKNIKAYYLPFKFTSEVLTSNKIKSLSSNHFKMYVGELKVLKYISKSHFNILTFYFSSFLLTLKLFRRIAKNFFFNG